MVWAALLRLWSQKSFWPPARFRGNVFMLMHPGHDTRNS
jgi:hypothetical protein